MSMMDREKVPYNLVAHAHNGPALRRTVHDSLGVFISPSVARGMLGLLEGSTIEAELAEYASLPDYIADLQNQDAEV